MIFELSKWRGLLGRNLLRNAFVAFVVAYGVFTFTFQCMQYARFNVPYGDVGEIGAMAWVAWDFGRYFFNNNLPYFALDGAFILSVISPLEHFLGIYVLFILESVCLSTTAFYIFLYARRRLNPTFSVLIPVMFLATPSVLAQPDWGFDPLVISMCAFTMFVYYSLDRNLDKSDLIYKRLAVYLLLIVALLSKNEAALVGVGLGLAFLFKPGKRALG
ncbi:MAG: DUF2079 domain-containing protein, partial [Firmicutes bacterium]|nr:DUF2079 domain-containing protein [Bacillota bacterium]